MIVIWLWFILTQDEKMMLGLQNPYVFHWGGAERDNDEGNEKEGICN